MNLLHRLFFWTANILPSTGYSQNYNILYNKAVELIGTTKDSSFAINDLLADVDAVNIKNKLGSSSMAEVFRNYYIYHTNTRFRDFAKIYSGNNLLKEQFRGTVGGYTNDTLGVISMKWPLFEGVSVSYIQSIAVRDAFTEIIWNKVMAE